MIYRFTQKKNSQKDSKKNIGCIPIHSSILTHNSLPSSPKALFNIPFETQSRYANLSPRATNHPPHHYTSDFPPCFRLEPHFPRVSLIYLLLLVNAELAGAAVDEEEKTADDGEDLEEVVLGEVLVGVELAQLKQRAQTVSNPDHGSKKEGVGGRDFIRHPGEKGKRGQNSQSRSC